MQQQPPPTPRVNPGRSFQRFQKEFRTLRTPSYDEKSKYEAVHIPVYDPETQTTKYT